MSNVELDSRMLNSTINVYRKQYTASDVGDFSDTDHVVYSAIPACIQPKVSDLIFEVQGNTFNQTHLCYLNKDAIDIKPNDIVRDITSEINYIVISIDKFKTIQSSDIHHIRLSLQAVGDKGVDLNTGSDTSSKVHVHK